MKRRSRRPVVLLLSLAPVAAAAQERPPGEAPHQVHPPTRWRAQVETLPPVQVELVQIDAVVTDRNGVPVRDLTREAFELLEDGKPQRIAHFGAGSRSRPVVPEAAPPPKAERAVPASPVEIGRGRHIVLAVDDLHIAHGNLVPAKQALMRFVEERLGDGDQVALVTTSGTLGLFQQFTTDRAVLKHALSRLTAQQRSVPGDGVPYLSEYQAEAIDRGDSEALRLAVQEIIQQQGTSQGIAPPPAQGNAGQETVPPLPGATLEAIARTQAQNKARAMLSEIVHLSGRTLGTIDQVVRSLAPVAGRKLVLLVSDGFLVGMGARQSRSFDLRRIVDAGTRSGVVIYSLDTRGLVATPPGGDASFAGGPVHGAPGVRESLQHSGESAMRDGMGALADDTGGFLVHSTNDLDVGLRRIIEDDESYYVLAYEPSNAARDGRFREIEIKLPGRPDLEVRTRKGYFAPDDRRRTEKVPEKPRSPERAAKDLAERRDEEIRMGLASLMPLRGVPVRMTADFVSLPPSGSQVVVNALIDVSSVRFEKVRDRYQAAVEVVGVIYDDGGKVAADLQAVRTGMNLRRPTYEKLLRERLLYQKSAPLVPGRYQVRLVAREEGTASGGNKLGSASQWIEVPDLGQGKLALSGVFLAAAPAPAEGQPVATADGRHVIKRFERTEGLYFQVCIYNPTVDEKGATDLMIQTQVWSGTKAAASSPAQAVEFQRERVALYASRINLDVFEPGEYELRVVATDKKADASALRRVTFTVE